MLAIHINNPDAESFIKQEFGNDETTLISKFVEFIKIQKQKREVLESIEEIENGDFYDINEAFRIISDKYSTS
jgi:hypothetical protein